MARAREVMQVGIDLLGDRTICTANYGIDYSLINPIYFLNINDYSYYGVIINNILAYDRYARRITVRNIPYCYLWPWQVVRFVCVCVIKSNGK